MALIFQRQGKSYETFFWKSRSPSIRHGARVVMCQVLKYWQRTRIPLIQEVRVVEKIESLLNEWQQLMRSKSRKSLTEDKKRQVFCNKLDTLFDISKKTANQGMELMEAMEKNEALKRAIKEDRLFLVAIRASVQSASLGGVDKSCATVERKRSTRKERSRMQSECLEFRRRRDTQKQRSFSESMAHLESEDDESEESCDENENWSPPKKRRSRRKVLSNSFAEALDVSQVSARGATKIVAAAACAFGIEIDDTNINLSSVYRERVNCRANLAAEIKSSFKPCSVLTVHWDGKIVDDLSGVGHIDRQAVAVTGLSTKQLLSMEAMKRGTGEAIANAVVNSVRDWKIQDNIKALSFDTTSTNTGRLQGAAMRIEKALGKHLLWLPCRHHVFELVMEVSFHSVMGSSKGPEVKEFNDFKSKWLEVNQDLYSPAVTNGQALSPHLKPCILKEIIDFATQQINVNQPRDDFLELLELSIIFCGCTPPKGVNFKKPGPTSSARWMAKCIYCLKMWLFRGQYQLDEDFCAGLLQLSLFIVCVYIRAWFVAPLSCSAPQNDIMFLKSLLNFDEINPTISRAASKKFLDHCWYLSEVNMGFAFFDETLSDTVRQELVSKLRSSQGTKNPPKKKKISSGDVLNLKLSDLVSTSTLLFFQILEIDTNFLDLPVYEWRSNAEYLRALPIVESLNVTNDEAERKIKLLKDYNKSVTKNEDSFQNLLLTVESHRKSLPSINKASLQEKYSSKRSK